MSKTRLFIVHGFMAKPSHHWFPWLKNELETADIDVFIPELPTPESPVLAEWLTALENAVGTVDKNTWFVAHSLGCALTLRFLAQLPADQAPQGIIMVSGFNESLPLWKEYNLSGVEEFIHPRVNMDEIVRNVEHRYVVASLNDAIVPTELTLRLSQQLKAPFYAIPESGHFLSDDGVNDLPLVAELFHRARNQ